jgi:lipopolysaccharide biosynthesis glycosyltransferase
MRYYCTYFDRNYLVKALALIESLSRHEKTPYRIYVVCLDELTRLLLTKLNLPGVQPIALHDIERGDIKLAEAKKARTLVEYYWTLTPTVIFRILEAHPDIDVLTYLDADLFFYSSPDPIYRELGTGSVLIHEHR